MTIRVNVLAMTVAADKSPKLNRRERLTLQSLIGHKSQRIARKVQPDPVFDTSWMRTGSTMAITLAFQTFAR